MTRHTLLPGLIFLAVSTFGQTQEISKPPSAPTRKSEMIDRKNKECVHRLRFNLTQRLQFYPFNRAMQIKAVSFDNKPDSNGVTVPNGRLPTNNDTIDYSQLDEIKILTRRQIESLTDILYNTGFKKQPMTESESCYNPRNAVLFIDSAGKTFAFIELCFQCGGHRESSAEVKTGDFCSDKYDLLKNYFAGLGIKIGISKGIGLIMH